eukprot:1352856-Pyramimonas_sp.AAC.1
MFFPAPCLPLFLLALLLCIARARIKALDDASVRAKGVFRPRAIQLLAVGVAVPLCPPCRRCRASKAQLSDLSLWVKELSWYRFFGPLKPETAKDAPQTGTAQPERAPRPLQDGSSGLHDRPPRGCLPRVVMPPPPSSLSLRAQL